jgi:hypothetical protein
MRQQPERKAPISSPNPGALMLKDCALDVKFQALGAIALPTTTDVDPPAPNDALWPDVVGTTPGVQLATVP